MTSLNQFSARSSPIGVIAIMVYLLLTAGLKITTPSVFNIVPMTVARNISVNSSTTLPILDGGWNQDLIARSAGVAPVLNNKTGLPALGLAGNVLYGALDINSGRGNVTVTSHTINITCSYPAGQARDSFNFSLGGVDDDGFEILHLLLPNTTSSVSQPVGSIKSMAPNSFSRFYLPYNVLPDNQMMWAASLPIVDSNGNLAPAMKLPAPLNPLMAGLQVSVFWYDNSGHGFIASPSRANRTTISRLGWQALYKLNITQLNFAVCKMGITKATTILDAQTRLPLEEPPRKLTSTWTPIERFEFASSPTELFQWNDLFENSSTTSIPHGTSACKTSPSGQSLPFPNNDTNFILPQCNFIDQAERFLYDRLGMQQAASLVDPSFFVNPIGTPLHDIPNVTVALHDFENALEDYTAAIIWAGTQLNSSAVLETTEVLKDDPAARLQLVLLPIITGLSFSSILLFLTPIITMPTLRSKGPASLVGTLGVLEVLWLSKMDKRFQNAREQIDETDEPSGKQLRKTIRRYDQSGKKQLRELRRLKRTRRKIEKSEGMNKV